MCNERRSYMTSRERVLTALRHEEGDRIPVGEMQICSSVSSEILGREAITGEGGWTVKTMKEMVIDGRREEFVERIAMDSVDVNLKVGNDLILTELDPDKDSPLVYKDVTDTSWTVMDEETGHWAKFVYKESSDTVHEIDSFEKQGGVKAVEEHLDIIEKRGYRTDDSCFDSTRMVYNKVGKELFTLAKVPNLIPSGRSWYADFMEMMYEEPELTQRICDVYLKAGMEVVKKYKEIGLDGVMIATDWAYNLGPLFSPDKIREYLIPQVKTISEYCHANGMYVMKHTDGNIMTFADDFFNMGIDIFQSIEPNAGMDIGEVKKLYGDKVTLMGNVDIGRTLPYGTTEEVVTETKAVIKAASPGGGHILSSCNVLAYPTPAKNYLAMVETAKEFGTYPIEL